jgi:predicted enzyme related to lactoylglutathione lyase
MAAPPCRFVWYELVTTDDVAATRFYESVIGWRATDGSLPDNRYTLMNAGEAMVAGVMTLPAKLAARGVPPHWTGYVGVADLDATLAALRQAGGTVHWGPEEIPNVGILAAIADPQGAALSLMQPASGAAAPPAAPPGTPGHAGWHELHATDGAAAFDFYASLFGWTKNVAHDMGEHGVYQTFDTGELWAGGMMTKSAREPAPHWLYYFNVDAAGAAIERIKAAGGTVILGPQPVPGGSFVVVAQDPLGAHFAVVSRTP